MGFSVIVETIPGITDTIATITYPLSSVPDGGRLVSLLLCLDGANVWPRSRQWCHGSEIIRMFRQSRCCWAQLVVFHRSSGSALVCPCNACADLLVVASPLPAVCRRHAWGCMRWTFSWHVQSIRTVTGAKILKYRKYHRTQDFSIQYPVLPLDANQVARQDTCNAVQAA